MILPRHWNMKEHAGADCCDQPCEEVALPSGGSVWICFNCGATCHLCGKGKRCVLPLGHEKLADFSMHESRTGSQVPSAQ